MKTGGASILAGLRGVFGINFFLISIGIFFLVAKDLSAQANLSSKVNLDFKFFNTKEGLSHNNVFTLFQDSEGFIWIGTENGLNLYNGHNFKQFKREGKTDNEICGSEISSVVEDKNGTIWIGTYNNGLCSFNKRTGKFNKIHLEDEFKRTSNSIHSLYVQGNNLWIGFETGFIAKLNIHDLSFKNFNPTFDIGRKVVFNDAIRSVFSDDENIWASTNSGYLYKIDLETENFELLNISQKAGLIIQIVQIQNWKDGKFILTTSNGFYTFDKRTNEVEHMSFHGEDFRYKMNDLFVDKDQNIWILTEGIGIVVYTPNGTRLLFDKQQYKYQWIPELDVRKIIQSQDGLVWIGSYGGGVFQFNPNKLVFNHYMFDPADIQGLRDDGINCFMEAPDQKMWVGTDASGLHLFDPEKGEFRNFYNDRVLSYFEKSSVLFIKEAKDKDHLWIGTYKRGLVYFNTKTGSHQNFEYVQQKSFHPSHAIYSILDFDDQYLWLGTNGYGILVFDKIRKVYTGRYYLTSNDSSLSNDYIRKLYKDSHGDIWVGNYAGVCKYMGGKNFKRYEHIALDSSTIHAGLVSEIFEDSKGRFWLGNSGAGLILMDREKDRFYEYDKNDGLNPNHICGIKEDEKGHLWMISNNGLILADIENSEAAKPKINFRYFYKENGLQDNGFILNSICQNSSEVIYVGGQNGFNFFKPELVSGLKDYNLKIYLEDFALNGKSFLPNEHSEIPNTVEYLDTLKLQYGSSDFSFNITAINYEIVQLLKYAYILESYETNWNFLDDSRRVTYTNLPLGIYYLKVKVSTDGRDWVERKKNLTIIVEGPWYYYWYGRTIIFIAILLLMFLIYLVRLNSVRRQKLKLQRRVDEQSAEIRKQNGELVLRNEQLNRQYEEIVKSREEIKVKNEDLEEVQNKLKNVNSLLEAKVAKRTGQLNSTIDQLNETIIKLDSFLFETSNELGNPIIAISGFLEVLKLDEQNQKNKTYLDHIERNIHKLELIRNQLISFSRNKRSALSFEKIELKKLLNDVRNDISVQYPLDGIEIHNTINDKAVIFSDRQRLRIAFTNILSNAVMYADKNKDQRVVDIQSFENIVHWEIMIKDNGIGINKKHLSKIFDMFFKIDGTSEGSGLGLFISKEILNNLKANISVESGEGEGTTVHVTFPKVKNR